MECSVTNIVRKSSCLLLFALVTDFLVSPRAVLAQNEPGQTRDVSGLSIGFAGGQRIPHPASLALELFDSLQLTPRQVLEIRDIQERMEEAMFAIMARAASTATPLQASLWNEEDIDEAELRSRFQRAAEVQADLFLSVFRARGEVFEVLSEKQRLELLNAYRTRYAQPTPPDSPAVSTLPCLVGGSGGGSQVSDRVRLVYSADFEGDSAHIGAVFVGRADVKLYGSPAPRERPQFPDGPKHLSGASMGIWSMGYEETTETAWVHTKAVPLGEGNVVLLDGIDSLHELPTVVGVVQMPSRVFTGGCPQGRPWHQILLEELESVPEIRDFIHNRDSEGAAGGSPSQFE